MVGCIFKRVECKWLIAIICLSAYIILISLIKLLIKKSNNRESKFNFSIILKTIYNIISIDYFITYLFKREFKRTKVDVIDNKDELGSLIKKFNSGNLLLSMVLCVIVIILNFIITNIQFRFAILCFIGIRYISRSLEIILAFISDLFEDKKSSNLNNNNRIKLAFTSLLEIILLSFSCILIIKNKFLKSFIDSLSPLFFDYNQCNIIKIIQLFESVSFYALMSLYIVNIFTMKSDNKRISTAIYVKIPSHWSEVKCYYWHRKVCELSNDSNKMIDIKITDWPGKALEKIRENIYHINLPDNANMIIFNDGKSEKSIDIELIESNYYNIK